MAGKNNIINNTKNLDEKSGVTLDFATSILDTGGDITISGDHLMENPKEKPANVPIIDINTIEKGVEKDDKEQLNLSITSKDHIESVSKPSVSKLIMTQLSSWVSTISESLPPITKDLKNKHEVKQNSSTEDKDEGLKKILHKRAKSRYISILFSETIALAFIFGLVLGPTLALGSPTQKYPGYSPNTNKIDFREIIHKTGVPSKLEQLISTTKEYRTVQAEFVAVETYEFHLGDIIESTTSDIMETCAQIEMYTEACLSDDNECQYSHEMLEVNSRTIEDLIHSLNTMSRVCSMPEIPRSQAVIARCEQGEIGHLLKGLYSRKKSSKTKALAHQNFGKNASLFQCQLLS